MSMKRSKRKKINGGTRMKNRGCGGRGEEDGTRERRTEDLGEERTNRLLRGRETGGGEGERG